ncbi:MAG TPA: D-2-hydroxyacid dehydrogenase [Candidatus Paceibacterota bacterium]
MRKLLVISNDLAERGAKPGAHTFHQAHEGKIRATAGNNAEVVITAPDEAPAHYADAEVIAAFPMRIPDIAKTPTVKWLHSFSAGVDRILSPAMIDSDILVTNSSGIHATPIAEHILGVCLMFVRRFHDALRNQEKHIWQKLEPLGELREKNILIVGLGEIGTEAARLAHAFGAHVSAVSRSPKNKTTFVERLEKSDHLDAMLPEADFVVITLPHTDETHHLFDEKKFALMKKVAVVINIGRGGIVNELDLIEALQKGTIAGAALDVFEKEPLPGDSPLWDMPNVIITPHHSGLSEKYMDRAVELLCKNLAAYQKGEELPNEVNKKLGY